MGRERPHLLLLASTLPGTDGLELMQRVLKVTDAPVVVLSEPVQDPALAFEAEADDYIAKPFSPTELVARVGSGAAAAGSAGQGVVPGILPVGRTGH